MGNVFDGSATAVISGGLLKLKSKQVDEAVIEIKNGADLALAMNEGGKAYLKCSFLICRKKIMSVNFLEDAKSDNVHFVCTRFKERTEC